MPSEDNHGRVEREVASIDSGAANWVNSDQKINRQNF
jgi:hypothetical protein